jgi:hypothetical protein
MKPTTTLVTVVSALALSGCQIRAWSSTTGGGPKTAAAPASEEHSGPTRTPTSSTSPTSPGEAPRPAAKEAKAPYGSAAAVADYDSAMKAIPAIKEAADVVPVRQSLGSCSSHLSGLNKDNAAYVLQTSTGPMTAEVLRTTCKTKYDELVARKYAGCFARDVDMKSFSTGGGSWTPIEYSTPYSNYSPFKCSEMPKFQKTPSAFGGLAPRIMKECGGAPSVVEFAGDGWNHKPLINGGVERTAAADCWFKGEMLAKDW